MVSRKWPKQTCSIVRKCALDRMGETAARNLRPVSKDPAPLANQTGKRSVTATAGASARWVRRNAHEADQVFEGGPVRRGACCWLCRRWRSRRTGPPLEDTVSSLNTTWVIVAGVLVMFMQAGFALLEIGFSRMKNAGTGIAKILTNFSIASLCVLGGRVRARLRRRGDDRGDSGFFLDVSSVPSEAATAVPVPRDLQHQPGGVHVLPVRVLRGLAGDRVGHDAGADQVRRLRDLRDHLQRGDLPDHQPLDLRWRLAAGERRYAGLRRLDGGPPDRRDRGAGGAAVARSADRQVRA